MALSTASTLSSESDVLPWSVTLNGPSVARDSGNRGLVSSGSKAGLISYGARLIFEMVNFVTICGSISVFGFVSNSLNIVVFIKQGFRDSMNTSLLGLAVADLLCVITNFWTSICFNPLFATATLPFDPLDLVYLSGGWPHSCFNRVTSFITAFITLERCLCILQPLKVKTIITPGRTKVIIIAIFLVMISLFSPFYYANRLEWTYKPRLNRTILTLTFSHNREEIETPTFYIHSVAMTTVSLFTVIVCTILLVIKLNQKSKWRQATVAQNTNVQDTTSLKDKRVVKMVTIISTIFIVCFLPATMIFFMMAYEPEFSFSGRYEHIYFSVWSVAFPLETFSSSVNILIYLKMSSKFRKTFVEIVSSSFGGKMA